MKNIIEILRELSVEVPEEKHAELTRAVSENYKTIAEFDKVAKKRDEYKASLDTVEEKLKGFDGVDVESLKGQISTLTTQLEGERNARKEDSARAKREANVQAFLAGKKFINGITEDSIRRQILEALAENTGESVEQIFAKLTTGEDGAPLPNIFAQEAENRPRFTSAIGSKSAANLPTVSREEIIAMKDPVARQSRIAKHPELFPELFGIKFNK